MFASAAATGALAFALHAQQAQIDSVGSFTDVGIANMLAGTILTGIAAGHRASLSVPDTHGHLLVPRSNRQMAADSFSLVRSPAQGPDWPTCP